MENGKYYYAGERFLSIPEAHAKWLLSVNDPVVTLLYFYMLAADAPISLKDASKKLNIDVSALHSASERMLADGIASLEEPAVPAEKTMSDSAFQYIVDTTSQIMGRDISMAEKRTLFLFYDTFALPPSVVLALIQYRRDMQNALNPERPLSVLDMRTEAEEWSRLKILTAEQAESHVLDMEAKLYAERSIMAALGIKKYKLSSAERKYISDWSKLGFDTSIYRLVVARIPLQNGRPPWVAWDTLLRSWAAKGWHTDADVISDGETVPVLL